ncbi:HEAT repeat domain-containing protein [Geminocystis sp. GBBB08]|uniref:HEAT repeat domain-containing protein n=1 Tax=Geminocystis sp. GBBB08 TaxID=2604140 RepID=UPI0027E21BCF|nr:HEAT repeat domain-containing protein [Geminocystis sp. GBBB08]MBL1210688.1 HEAT repeat domain-containing protein [Geminocystis sp. GBBB08]
MSKTEIKYTANSIQLSETETDALLEKVEQKLFTHSFDFNDHDTIAKMVESMGDKRGMTRLKFAERLGIIGKPAVPFLLEALANHPNAVVRRASAKTLTLIADPNAVPNLVYALLHDEDTVVQGSCIGALARTGEASVPELLKIIADEGQNETIKGHASWALAFIGSQASEYLYQGINSDSIDVRCAVISALGSLVQEQQDEEALKILVNSLKDSETIIRCEAAAILSKVNQPLVVTNLIDCLQDSEPEVRKSVALALMKMVDRTTLEPLENALNKETEESIKPIFNLAINQIKRNLEE